MPDTHNAYDIGLVGTRWKTLYLEGMANATGGFTTPASISADTSIVSGPLRWTAATSTISSASTLIFTSADSEVSFDDDNLTTTGTITSGDITIFNPTPILVFQDSNSLGGASVGFIEWRDSGGGRAGFFGNSSSGNDDLYWKNEQGGNIGIETTGAGVFQIFADTDAQDNNFTTTGVVRGGLGSRFGDATNNFWTFDEFAIFGGVYPLLTPTAEPGPGANFGIIEGALILMEGTTASGGVVQLFFTNQAGTVTSQIVFTVSTDIMAFEDATKYTFDNDVDLLTNDLTTTGGVTAGASTFGDGGTTDYVAFGAGGEVTLHGTAKTWDDIRIVPGAFQFAGVSDPTLESWQPGGAGATFKVYKFKKDDEVFFTCQVPHNYLEGSDLLPHLHWTPGDRGNEENGATVGWKIDVSWANRGVVFPASETISLSDACTGTDDLHEKTASGNMSGTNKTISGVIQGRLYRSDTGADDTWAGAIAAQSPIILEIDFHYEIDGLGSDLERTK